MELENSFVVPADIDTAWQTLLDVEAIAPCMPGATLTSFDGDSFTADVKVKLGPVLMTFAGAGRFTSQDESTRTVVIEAKGKEKKGAGTAAALVTTRLEATGPDSTTAHIVTDLTITGKAAQFGRGVMVDVSKHLINQFARNLETVITARKVPAASVNPANPDAPSEVDAPAVTQARPVAPVLDNQPLDLGSAAMVPVLKRAVPALVVVAAVVAVIWWVVTR